jgi:hypothetical protein
MKLLQEANFEIKRQEEENKIFFEGVFIQMNTINRNNRFYPAEKISPIIEEYIQNQVNTGKAVGEADHPTNPNLNIDRISHRIISLTREGNNYMGRALVLDTPMGNVVKGLLKGGVQFGVSTRAVGKVSLTNEGYEEVGTPFILVTAGDVVMTPSAPDAFVQAVMENKEWVLSAEGTWVSKIVEETKKAIEAAPAAQLKKVSFEAYHNFIKSISKSK